MSGHETRLDQIGLIGRERKILSGGLEKRQMISMSIINIYVPNVLQSQSYLS